MVLCMTENAFQTESKTANFFFQANSISEAPQFM